MPSTGVGGILVQSAPPGYTDPHQPGVYPGLTLQAQTPFAGVALVNATPTLLTWNVPQDGNVHWCILFAGCHVTSSETGGVVSVTYTLPDGTSFGHTLINGTIATGDNTAQPNTWFIPVAAGSQVVVNQSTALTAGAALVWVSIWGA